jgi:hypothetical protein
MDKLTIFIFFTGCAVALQAGVLLAMYVTMRKSGERMETLVTEVRTKFLPTVEHAQQLMADIRPKLEIIADNMAESTTRMRTQVERVDATISDVVDRARLQVIRADELLSRTLDRVEQTSDMVHKTVISPVRQVSGLMQGITVGLEFLFGGRARRNGSNREERRAVPQDEMFI